LLLPERFTGISTTPVAAGVAKILEYFSFPSLNVVFSAAGRLVPVSDQDLLLKGLLDELETRLTLQPLDKDGKKMPLESLSILGLEPSATEVRSEEEDGGGRTSMQFEYKPNISAIFDTIKQLSDPSDPPTSEPNPASAAAIAAVASAAAQGLQLAFGGRKDSKVKTVRRITQMASLASHREFAWYMRSFGDIKKDGVHFGTAFLQVSREVESIDVNIELKSDWAHVKKVANFPNQIKKLTKRIPVHHAPAPKTPILTDFASTSSIPIVVPRADVQNLLQIEDDELQDLIDSGQLKAFGEKKKHITKGSLVSLLDL
ncbi:MAG: hypothetical protein AAFV29_16745, partial [Myxococcota bacterium]